MTCYQPTLISWFTLLLYRREDKANLVPQSLLCIQEWIHFAEDKSPISSRNPTHGSDLSEWYMDYFWDSSSEKSLMKEWCLLHEKKWWNCYRTPASIKEHIFEAWKNEGWNDLKLIHRAVNLLFLLHLPSEELLSFLSPLSWWESRLVKFLTNVVPSHPGILVREHKKKKRQKSLLLVQNSSI